jgi:predicted acetyltransferase
MGATARARCVLSTTTDAKGRAVTISLRDAQGSRSAQLWIESVYRDYIDDLAPGMFPSLSEIGHSAADQCAYWFGNPGAHPLIILKEATPVGFAMVAKHLPSLRLPGVDFRMEDFFICRACRRLGIGQSAVRLILSRFAGRWEITQYLRNTGAVSFWRRVVAGYTDGNYQERIVNDEVRQVFDSACRT